MSEITFNISDFEPYENEIVAVMKCTKLRKLNNDGDYDDRYFTLNEYYPIIKKRVEVDYEDWDGEDIPEEQGYEDWLVLLHNGLGGDKKEFSSSEYWIEEYDDLDYVLHRYWKYSSNDNGYVLEPVEVSSIDGLTVVIPSDFLVELI